MIEAGIDYEKMEELARNLELTVSQEQQVLVLRPKPRLRELHERIVNGLLVVRQPNNTNGHGSMRY